MLAGLVVFHERLPSGFRTGLQIAAFAAFVLSAALLASREAPSKR
jgi:hypothetical protein